MEVNVPPYFLCPISLQIMRDPVTLTTGITYDRDSIHQWLLSSSPAGATPTCPVTKQPLLDTHLTPNSTLYRLIQTWCTANPAVGHPSTSPRVPLDKANIARLLRDLLRPNPEPDSLRKLRDVVTDSEDGRRMAEEAGAAHVLVDLAKQSTAGIDELIAVLHHLRPSEDGLRDLVTRNTDVVETLTGVMRVSTCQTREYAVSIARSLLEAVSPVRMVALRGEFFAEVVRVVEDRVSQKATKAALRLLAELMPWGRNRVRAAEAGAVGAIVELLLEEGRPESRRVWEMGMVAMEMVCGCAEGRQAVVGHAAGIAVVARGLLGVSRLATEKAARVLCAVAKNAGRAEVVREMAEVGAVSRLCVAMQVEEGGGDNGTGGRRTRERAVEVLRLHSKAWGKSPCVDSRLLATWL